MALFNTPNCKYSGGTKEMYLINAQDIKTLFPLVMKRKYGKRDRKILKFTNGST